MKNAAGTRKSLSPGQRTELHDALGTRFEQNMNRHRGVTWGAVKTRLEANPETFCSLSEMERTGGEPDVVGQDNKTGGTTRCIVPTLAQPAL